MIKLDININVTLMSSIATDSGEGGIYTGLEAELSKLSLLYNDYFTYSNTLYALNIIFSISITKDILFGRP